MATLINTSFTYKILDVPTTYLYGSPELSTRSGTSANGINDNGEFIGTFGQRDWTIWGVPHAFLYTTDILVSTPILGDIGTDNNYRYLDAPSNGFLPTGYGVTIPSGIDNVRDVVGTFTDEVIAGVNHGFEYSNGVYSFFDVPNAVSTEAKDINNLGQIVGTYQDSSGGSHGFVETNGAFVSINVPNANNTYVNGINDNGEIVGTVEDSLGRHGFTYNNGVFSIINVPNADFSYVNGINNDGFIVGTYRDSNNPSGYGYYRGFMEKDGIFTYFDIPSVTNTYINGISDNGQIIGSYWDGSTHGFMADIGVPGTGDDLLTGTTDDDIIDGLAGADTMTGGLGNDVYFVDNAGDKVIELSDGGTDTVNSSVTYILVANVEKLTLTGTAAVNGVGNGLKNVLAGNSAANVLNGAGGNDNLLGGGGNDILNGSLGNDKLTGGTGKDVFVFNTALTKTGIDKILDFNPVYDTIKLENAIFTALTTTGALAAANFVTAATAVDNNDFIVYNNTTGALYYDADANGAGAAVQIALIGTTTHAALTFADFVVI